MIQNAPLIPRSISTKFTNFVQPRFVASWNVPWLDFAAFRVFLAAFILAACFVRAYVGLSGSRIYTQDAFSILDGAWRVLNGQRPHVDFFTGLGPVTYLITAAGVILAAGNAAGLAYGQALFGCLAGLWAYRLAARRVRSVPAALFCAVVVLMAIVPVNMGESPDHITPGATYNRYGYALLALLMLESSAESRTPSRRGQFFGGLSTGLALGILLFLKISFFLGAIFLLAALLPLRKQDRVRWCGIAAAFVATSFGFACYLRFDLAAVLSDLQTVGHAKHVMTGWYLVKDVVVCALPFLLLVWLISRDVDSKTEAIAIRIAGLGVCLAGFFLLLTSWQFFGLPLDTVMAILLLDRTVPQAAFPALRSPRVTALLLGSAFAINYLAVETAGLNFAFFDKLHPPAYTSFTAPALAGFASSQRRYVEIINDGCDLLTRNRQARDTVLALDFNTPFSFALGMKPPAGGVTWLQYHTNFDESGPAPERVFEDSSLVMLPRKFSDYTLPASVPRIFGPYLEQNYALAAESPDWRLYRRKDSKQNDKASFTASR